MRTISTTVYTFDELSEEAQQKAISDHINFEIEVMDENSPYYELALKMEKMQTPWFLPEYIYEKAKDVIIETIRINNYEFTSEGKLI